MGTEEVAFGWKGLSLKDIGTLGGIWGNLEGAGSYKRRSARKEAQSISGVGRGQESPIKTMKIRPDIPHRRMELGDWEERDGEIRLGNPISLYSATAVTLDPTKYPFPCSQGN